ncbi:MAG: glycoside hydrolase family protein [Synechococcus sp.]
MARQLCDQAVEMVKHFEGLHLRAYRCPAQVLTNGYGRTGPTVHEGQVITEAVADQWLREDLVKYGEHVERLLPDMPFHTYCALTSFTFNCGAGALERSTLRLRILAGEDPYVVLPEELPKWVKAGGRTLAGLVRRRKAEVLHAQLDGPRGQPEEPEPQWDDTAAPVSLLPFFEWFRGQPHQVAAVEELEAVLKELEPALLFDDQPWVRQYRNKANRVVELPVPYQLQYDSQIPGMGSRMCFSSANAMLVEYLKPGLLRGEQADDTFVGIVERHGDTTSAEAQVAALLDCGIHASFRVDGTEATILEQLGKGVPVPIGILHKGDLRKEGPRGFGHWVLVVGVDVDADHYVVHDPAGRLNVQGGFYERDADLLAGRFARYPMDQLNDRWMVGGDGGWFIEVNR